MQKKKKKKKKKKKHQEGEREKVIESLGAFFLSHLGRTFPFSKSGGEKEELKPFKFERNMRVLRRSPRGVKEDGN